MPSVTAVPGLIGRKVGMMTLYDGSGRARGVTVLEMAGNRVTQIRTSDRDGYEAVQVGVPGDRKRTTRPERGHLGKAGLEREPLTELQEFHVTDIEAFELGQSLGVDQFEPGVYLNVTATSKGRGFAGGVRRWNFRGGPKTHGQSDRWRAPGSIGAGTTPGRVWKGQKMAGHMGARTATGLNQLLVYVDAGRQLLFVEGSVPGPRNGLVTVTLGRKNPMAGYEPPVLSVPEVGIEAPAEPELADEAVEEAEAVEATVEAAAEEAPEAELTEEAPATEADEAATEGEAPAEEESSAAAETETADEADDETKNEADA